MKITLVTRGYGRGAGTAGFAERLHDQWKAMGHQVYVRRPGESVVGLTMGLERVPHMDVVRLGGGWHADACRALDRRGLGQTWWTDWRTVRTAKHVVVNSAFVQKALRRRGVASTVVRTGVDLHRFQPARRGDQLVFLAHGWRRKNFETAVQATALLGARLTVGGRDSRRARRIRWARTLLGDRLTDLGEHVDPADVLPHAGVVLHPTRYDPAANLVLEAMACGVPVVSTVQDGSSELLPRGLVMRDPMDPSELARAVLFAREGGRGLVTALRQIAEAWPDSRNAEELEQVLSSVEAAAERSSHGSG